MVDIADPFYPSLLSLSPLSFSLSHLLVASLLYIFYIKLFSGDNQETLLYFYIPVIMLWPIYHHACFVDMTYLSTCQILCLLFYTASSESKHEGPCIPTLITYTASVLSQNTGLKTSCFILIIILWEIYGRGQT